MRGNPDEISPNNSTKNTPFLKIIDCSLRFSVIPLSIATIWFTVTNQQDNTLYGKLKFTNLTGLKFMVCISFVSAVYAFVAVMSSWVRCLATKAWFFFVSDQIAAYLMVISGAAVMEILYLAYSGDKEVSWSEACHSYGRFCNRMKLALVFHALAFCCFFVLALISAYRVFSMFEPPSLNNKEVEEQTT
ncbi:Casparian strip membrane protein [Parasponia andersonii]|uniref:CASP-like protein n=1 Tax=Parasponia andersonii TaxID=3476 RepID=A0A2P5BRQ8_PARAD|nr:Casparian strip membrane protein [Parasponia andersonii]